MSVSSAGIRKKSRRPPPGAQFKQSVKPCRSTAELTTLQQSTLVEAVNEAKAAEERRLQALSKAPSKARVQELSERHDKERVRDRERIEMLVSELEAVKKISSDGGLDASGRQRSMMAKVKTMDTNRFDQVHLRDVHAKWINRVDKLERKFENSTKPKYNEYDEKRKLMLMEEKRSVLRDMIDIQTETIRSLAHPGSARVSSQQAPYRQPMHPRSQSARSEASYATFASSSKSVVPVARNHNQFEARVNRLVPKLPIGGYTVLKSNV